MKGLETLNEEMPRDDCLAAVNHSALQIQIAVTQMTAFIIGYLDGECDEELVETAKRVVQEVDALCGQLRARDPQPWSQPFETKKH